MKILFLLLFLALTACNTNSIGGVSHYETIDGRSSLYLEEERFIFSNSFQENDAFAEYLQEVMAAAEKDRLGCLILGPLVLPVSIKNPSCERMSFLSERSEGSIILKSSCSFRGQECQIQRYNFEGELIEFQFVPDEPLSKPYRLVAGKPLKVKQ